MEPRSLSDFAFTLGGDARRRISKFTGIDETEFFRELEQAAAWFRVFHDLETKKTKTSELKRELQVVLDRTEQLLKSLDMDDPLFFTTLSHIDLDLLLELQLRLKDMRQAAESALRSIGSKRASGKRILFSQRELATSLAIALGSRGVEVTLLGDGALCRCLAVILRETERIELECGHIDFPTAYDPVKIVEQAWPRIHSALAQKSRSEFGIHRHRRAFEHELVVFKIKTLFQEFSDALRGDHAELTEEERANIAKEQVAEILQLEQDEVGKALS